jgi:aryl-alcohol dehydrogenase-like predicted oxidoreductase
LIVTKHSVCYVWCQRFLEDSFPARKRAGLGEPTILDWSDDAIFCHAGDEYDFSTMTEPGVGHTEFGPPGTSDFPLVLGGNAFGWTADRDATFAVLDRFVAAGGVLVDSADAYSAWVPGHRGGESEQMIGDWMRHRGADHGLRVATKAGRHPELRGLHPRTVKRALDASLLRLGVDAIDVYFAHFDDESVPIEDVVGTFSELVDAGKILRIGLSNFGPERIDAWFRAAEEGGHHRAVALQPNYNLMERGFEGAVRCAARRHGLAVLPYGGLARGFLTGKYRAAGPAVESAHAEPASKYVDARGERVLAVLDRIARDREISVATVALAWLRQQPTVLAPIAGARTAEQLDPLLASVGINLVDEELSALSAASEVIAGPATK